MRDETRGGLKKRLRRKEGQRSEGGRGEDLKKGGRRCEPLQKYVCHDVMVSIEKNLI